MLLGRLFKAAILGAFLTVSVKVANKLELFGSEQQLNVVDRVAAGIDRATGAYRLFAGRNVCEQPLAYRLGELDERFSLTFEQAKGALTRAENVWEEPLGRDLLSYDESAKFSINFVFDERQNETNAAQTFQNELNQTANIRDEIDVTYRELVDRHDKLSAEFAIKKQAFANQLNAYNLAVASHNESGGASKEAYRQLNIEQENLSVEQDDIDNMVRQLNGLADQINDVGNQNNQLVDSYNEDIAVFNNRFGVTREFTQGDYQGDRINVYQYRDQSELTLVLAHEFGHALQLDHVENQASIMYYLMGDQPPKPRLSEEDIEAFKLICGSIGAS